MWKKKKPSTWLEVNEKKMFKAVDDVATKQRRKNVYSGSRLENCERCSLVVEDISYPKGSPTGLRCSKKKIDVTAQAKCDHFTR